MKYYNASRVHKMLGNTIVTSIAQSGDMSGLFVGEQADYLFVYKWQDEHQPFEIVADGGIIVELRRCHDHIYCLAVRHPGGYDPVMERIEFEIPLERYEFLENGKSVSYCDLEYEMILVPERGFAPKGLKLAQETQP